MQHFVNDDFELIVFDNAALDEDSKAIQAICKAHRLNYIRVDWPFFNGIKRKFRKYAALACAQKFTYLAIMDADDIADSTRFQKQVDFLDAHTDFSLVSARAKYIDTNNNDLNKSIDFFESNDSIKCNLLFVNVIVHPCIMMRKSILDEHKLTYKVLAGEDFDLWIRIAQVSKVYNINEFLLSYRIHSNNMVHSNWYKLKEGIYTLLSDELNHYFPNLISDEEKMNHLSLVDFSLKNSSSDLPALQNWIQKLLLLNQTHKHFDEAILRQVVFKRVLKKYLRLADYNFSVISQLNEIKKILHPKLTWELRKKELAIIAFSTVHKKFMEV